MRIHPLAVLLALSLSPAARATCESVSYGTGVTLAESTPVSAILGQPAAYTGKEVRVEGEIKEVCAMAGCWMELAAADGGQTLKVKVKDGDIVFPVSARGKQGVAQGKIEDLEMTRAKYIKHLKHLAKENGEAFDEASVEGDGPFHVYQLAGTGAQICK